MKRRTKKWKLPRKLSLVKFDYDAIPPEYHTSYKKTFGVGEALVFLGEIPNMPGHCAIVMSNGEVKFGYHSDNFIELTGDEV